MADHKTEIRNLIHPGIFRIHSVLAPQRAAFLLVNIYMLYLTRYHCTLWVQLPPSAQFTSPRKLKNSLFDDVTKRLRLNVRLAELRREEVTHVNTVIRIVESPRYDVTAMRDHVSVIIVCGGIPGGVFISVTTTTF